MFSFLNFESYENEKAQNTGNFIRGEDGTHDVLQRISLPADGQEEPASGPVSILL